MLWVLSVWDAILGSCRAYQNTTEVMRPSFPLNWARLSLSGKSSLIKRENTGGEGGVKGRVEGAEGTHQVVSFVFELCNPKVISSVGWQVSYHGNH